MSEDTSNTTSTPITTETHTRRTKKETEIFGFPKDDVTLGLAAAGLGLAGIVGGKILYDMLQNGQLPNPFQPQNARVTYSDIYEQQRQQQEWEQQQRQAQQVQQQPQLQQQQQPQQPDGGDPSAQTMPAFSDYSGFDDEEEGVSYSTTVRKPKSNSFDRINGG